jgi:hypothetical protein
MAISDDMNNVLITNKKEFKENNYDNSKWWKRKYELDKRMQCLLEQFEILLGPHLHLLMSGSQDIGQPIIEILEEVSCDEPEGIINQYIESQLSLFKRQLSLFLL